MTTFQSNRLKNDQTILDNFKISSSTFDKQINNNNDGKSTSRSKYGGSINPTPK